MFVLKCRLQYLRDIGAAIAPFNSFLFLQGLQTLSLRMERHSQNALAVAQWLEGRDEVEWVAYPGLDSSKWKARADKYLPNGKGAIVAFELKGGIDAGRNFTECVPHGAANLRFVVDDKYEIGVRHDDRQVSRVRPGH